MTINEKHLLLGNVRFVHSPNHSGYLINQAPDTIIIHYTGGANAESSVRSLCDSKSKASAHLVIGRDGSVYQLVPFNQVAWHAGESEHKETGRTGINKYSVGIELDNAGLMTKKDDNNFIPWFGKSYPASEVIEATHRNESQPRWWHLYTDIQLLACLEICRLLKAKYPIRYVLGHEEIAPKRKVDPGPAFPLDSFRKKILELDRSDDESDFIALDGKDAYVNIDKLNIRTGAGVSFPLAQKEPLRYKTNLKVLKVEGKWLNVQTEDLFGWVNGKYVNHE